MEKRARQLCLCYTLSVCGATYPCRHATSTAVHYHTRLHISAVAATVYLAMHVILSRGGCSSVLGIQCPDSSMSDPHLMVNIWKDHLGTAIKPQNLFLYLHPDLLSAKVLHFCNSRFLKSCKNAKYTPSKPHSRNIWHHRRVAISILACSSVANNFT